MSRIGSTIRSAKMKLTTPPKLIPPRQSTAASGTFPTEQTKLTIATSGPTSGPSILAHVGSPVRKMPRHGDEAGREREAEQQREEDHHHEAADVLGGGEGPAEQDDEDDAELDHQVGR